MKNVRYKMLNEKHFIPRPSKLIEKNLMLLYVLELEDGFVGSYEEYKELFFNYIRTCDIPNRDMRRIMKRSK